MASRTSCSVIFSLKMFAPIARRTSPVRESRRCFRYGAGIHRHWPVSVDLKKLPRRFAGRVFDRALLGDLPEAVDCCGENGEFHTFVNAGPMLSKPIAVKTGEIVERDGAAYVDLQPA
jgi:diphthamide synthase (EF-2-diphthine--ammonia ligase)